MPGPAEHFSLWDRYFKDQSYKNVHEEFYNHIHDKKLCLEDKLFLADRCLQSIAVNLRKSTSSDSNVLKDVFALSELCCKVLSESWNAVKGSFINHVYYICKSLLAQKFIEEAVIVGEYALHYADLSEEGKTKEKCKTLIFISFLGLYLKALYELKLSDDKSHIFRGWNFVLSQSGAKMKHCSISYIVEYFCNFISKLKDNEFEKNRSEFHRLLHELSYRISEVEKCDEIFMKLLSSISSRVCDFINKEDQRFFIKFLQTFQEKCTSEVVNFCENMYRLYLIGFCEKDSLELIRKSKKQLENLLTMKCDKLRKPLYFASIVLMKRQEFFLENAISEVDDAEILFEMVLLVVEQINKLNLGDMFRAKEEDLEWKKLTIVSSLVSVIFTGIYSINDLKNTCISSKRIFNLALKAEEMIFNSFVRLGTVSKDRRIYLLQKIGANLINVCRIYMHPTFYPWCEQIVSKALEYFSTLPHDDFYDPALKTCWEKLVLSLTTTYRELKSYEDCLKTPLSWAVMLPSSIQFFLDLFCSCKNKLMMLDPEMSHLKITCLDLAQSEENMWKRSDFKNVNLPELCLKELEAYARHDVGLVEPVNKLLNYITESKMSSTGKMKSYYFASCIFSTYCDTLKEAERILPRIEEFIFKLEAEKMSKSTPVSSDEREYLKYIALLGDLYYAKFRIKLISMRVKNEADVKVMEAAAPAAAVEPELDKVGEEAYDFVTAGYTFNSQRKLLDVLGSALENWQQVVFNGGKESYGICITSLKETALMYRLYCDNAKEKEAWELLYLIAKLENEIEATVYAFNNLVNTSWEMNPEWENEVVTKYLNNVNQNTKLNYQLDYLSRCFKRGFTPENKAALMKLSIDGIKEPITFAKYYFLMSRFNISSEVEESTSYYEFSVTAFKVIIGEIKDDQWRTFCENIEMQCLLFDLGHFIVSRLIEEYNLHLSKMYLKETLTMIQRLGLPLRTCQFLNLSARLDTLTGNMDECNMKLTNVYRILDEKMETDVFYQFIVMQLETKMPSDIRAAPSFNDFDFEGLPQVQKDPKFQMPEFASHNSKCTCFICKNPVYLKSFCEVTFVFALYFRAINKREFADEYFKGIFQLLKICKESFDAVELAVVVTIHYIDYLADNGEFGKAEFLNKVLLNARGQVQNQKLDKDLKEQMWHLQGKKMLKKMPRVELQLKKTMKRELTSTKNTLPLKTPAKGHQVISHQGIGDMPMPDITPLPRYSRRALSFDDYVPKTVRKTTERKKKTMKKEFDTPPDIVLDLPSTIEKRRQKLESKSVAKKENTTSNTIGKNQRCRRIFLAASGLREDENSQSLNRTEDEQTETENTRKIQRRRKIFAASSEFIETENAQALKQEKKDEEPTEAATTTKTHQRTKIFPVLVEEHEPENATSSKQNEENRNLENTKNVKVGVSRRTTRSRKVLVDSVLTTENVREDGNGTRISATAERKFRTLFADSFHPSDMATRNMRGKKETKLQTYSRLSKKN